MGVDTKVHYPIPLHLQKCAESFNYKKGDIPNAERLANSMISLPIYPTMTNEEMNHVCFAINTVIAEAKATQ